jgi:3',5'-nucleoside bisphosphate phosphatase
MFTCDLHIHSLSSDGRYFPKDIAKMAKIKDLSYFALTDHDTLSGIDEALEEANKLNINFIPGIELSTEYNGESIHVLGFFDRESYKNPELNKALEDLKKKRISRAYKMVDNLKKFHNIEIDIDKVLSAGKDTVARPHIAKVIIDAGYPYDHDYIFNNFIGNDCPAYIPSTKMTTKEGIDLLKKYNAMVFLAHPVLIKKSPVEEILSFGFDGLEAIYFQNSEDDTKRFLNLAREKKLFISCGSDCHGIENDTRHGNVGEIKVPQNEEIINMLSWLKNIN